MSKAVDRAAEQVYRGIWHGLVKWFKVPDEPPTLPTSPGEHLERFKPAAPVPFEIAPKGTDGLLPGLASGVKPYGGACASTKLVRSQL